MELAIDIVKSLLLPKLEKDASFDANQTNIAFWETITTTFLDFERGAKPVYATIYSLGLKDAENIISKLDTVYISFIKELAENHVLGISSEAIDYLITSKNSAFEKEVHFFTDLQNAINKVERKRIKTELPKTFDELSFEITDDAIALVIKKKEREALKEKMKAWNKQLVTTEEIPVYSLNIKNDTSVNENTKQTKVISLHWIKYFVAACLVLGIGIWFFDNQNQSIIPSTNVVTTTVKKDTTSKVTVTPVIPSEALAEVATVTKNAPIIKSGLGYASKNNNIKIIENNQKARKVSIVKAIENYQKMSEDKFTKNKVSYETRAKAIQSTIRELQKELALLEEREKHYVFDGKALVLYVSTTAKENSIILYDDSYYLKKDTDFYKLTIANQPQAYKKEINSEVLSKLDEIIFDNGN